MRIEDHKTIKLIQESGMLPAISETFGVALNMLLVPVHYDMDSCIDELVKYPELEQMLLNSLNRGYGLRRTIQSVKEAVVYLGAKNARIIIIAYITKLLLPNQGKTEIFDDIKYWNHCLATSIASYLIAERTGLSEGDKLFTYGLVHDIGVTVLDICLPELLSQIYSLQLKGSHQIVAEKLILDGLTHAEIGMWFCKKLGLSKEVTEIVGYHHTPFIANNLSDEVKIMHMADSISTNYYERLLGNDTTFLFSERIRLDLNIPIEFIHEISGKLPEEVEKVNQIINMNIFR